MSVDISGFGLSVQLIASNTFPVVGIFLNQFADDADPFDIPELQIKDSAMGVNGDLITWSKANPIKTSISVVPGGVDDNLLSILLEANRVGRGKNGAFDQITLVGVYTKENEPGGREVTFLNGVITDGSPGISVSSSGRYKTRTYNFSFENKVEVFF